MTDNAAEAGLLEMLGAIYVQLSRIYDTQILLLSESNKFAADKIIERHEQGYVLGPNPILVEENFLDEVHSTDIDNVESKE